MSRSKTSRALDRAGQGASARKGASAALSNSTPWWPAHADDPAEVAVGRRPTGAYGLAPRRRWATRLYAVNPAAAARAIESVDGSSGAKFDAGDATVLADMVSHRPPQASSGAAGDSDFAEAPVQAPGPDPPAPGVVPSPLEQVEQLRTALAREFFTGCAGRLLERAVRPRRRP